MQGSSETACSAEVGVNAVPGSAMWMSFLIRSEIPACASIAILAVPAANRSSAVQIER